MIKRLRNIVFILCLFLSQQAKTSETIEYLIMALPYIFSFDIGLEAEPKKPSDKSLILGGSVNFFHMLGFNASIQYLYATRSSASYIGGLGYIHIMELLGSPSIISLVFGGGHFNQKENTQLFVDKGFYMEAGLSILKRSPILNADILYRIKFHENDQVSHTINIIFSIL